MIKKACDILDLTLKKHKINLPEGKRQERKWEIIVGDRLAKFSRIKDIKNGIIIVEGSDPIVRNILAIQKDNILKRLKLVYKEIKIYDMKIVKKAL